VLTVYFLVIVEQEQRARRDVLPDLNEDLPLDEVQTS
jgi:hypothetical protein